MYKIIVFDLDDTLSKSKTKADDEMIELLGKLLEKYKVAIITGGEFKQIGKQIFNYFSEDYNLNNFYLYPTCGAKMVEYKNNQFEEKYSEDLKEEEINKIIKTLDKAISDLDLTEKKIYGQSIDNRGTQITYSPLGNECPLEIKTKWDPDCKKRQQICDYINKDLKDFKLGIAGRSSIDITRKGIDKSYGIKKIISELGIEKEEILFIGDMLMPGGNDYPVKEFGIDCVEVSNPEDTKKYIKKLIK